jgi:hypothetical protein
VRDRILPLLADVLVARGYMGDGSIDFPPFATLSTRPDTGATSRSRCSTPTFGRLGADVIASVVRHFLDVVVPDNAPA